MDFLRFTSQEICCQNLTLYLSTGLAGEAQIADETRHKCQKDYNKIPQVYFQNKTPCVDLTCTLFRNISSLKLSIR